MPTYTLKNKQDNSEMDKFMSISEMESFIKENPDWEVLCGKPLIGYTINQNKPDKEFKSLLKEIKRRNPRSTIDV